MTIVVLGGGIARDGNLPKHVKKRIERAWQIFKKKKGAPILVCGRYSFLYPKNQLPKKTESRAMRDYLISLGVPKKDIYLENESKDTIGNAYYAKKLYFIPRKEKKATIITSEFHLERVKFIFQKIFGKNYQLKFISLSSSLGSKEKTKVMERQKKLLEKTKAILAEMKSGDHSFLKDKLYKIKYYKEPRPDWVIKFVAAGK
ncbi:YdcF family protein [Candidatus Parcubacteria bacterium]|nr:YdcF family protein [Candidatus Parcubacteria bacterium]